MAISSAPSSEAAEAAHRAAEWHAQLRHEEKWGEACHRHWQPGRPWSCNRASVLYHVGRSLGHFGT